MSNKGRRALIALAAVAGVAITSGCGLTVEDLPLPKPGQSGETYTLHAVFENALNLPDQAKVKIGGSDVGVVSNIRTKNFQAVVDLTIDSDIELPEGSTAELRQATPLGDVFVAMSKPVAEPGAAMLSDGDTLTLEQTSAGATVEQLLISVSLLFNGGGVAALTKVGAELDSIIGGRGEQVGHLIAELTGVIGSLNENSARVDSTLEQFHTLAGTLESKRAELGEVADTLPQMIGVIAENNQAIGELLTKLSTASAAIGDYSVTSGEQLQNLLDNTHELMNALAATGSDFELMLDRMHEIRPKVDATFRGRSFSVFATATNLDVSALTDPAYAGLWDLDDVADFTGSLLQVMQLVQGRVEGGQR